jgi:SAM-dependent methyltransferase
VVEIGAGGGWNLIKYKNNGYDHYGFDLDANLINFGREKYKLNLLPGGIEEAKKLGLKADYVLLLHVLEHTEDPLNLLVSLKDILSDNAVLQIGVPSLNMLIFGGSTVGKSLIETLQLAHNFLFDEFTLRFFLLKAGYKIHVCFGETIIVKKEEAQKSRRLLESMDRYISDSHRGYKIVKYLKLCEFFNVKRRKILPNFVDNNFHYLYYTKKPVQFFKLMLIFKYGIFI